MGKKNRTVINESVMTTMPLVNAASGGDGVVDVTKAARPAPAKEVKTVNDRLVCVRKDKAFHSSWRKKLEEREKRKQWSAQKKQMKDDMSAAKKKKAEDRKRKEEQRLVNQKKGQQYQVVKNTKSLKKMSKGQLKTLIKMDPMSGGIS